MSEGVVIFSQKDIDDDLMADMEVYAKGMGMSIPDMLRQLFVNRVAADMACHRLTGNFSKEVMIDAKVSKLVDDYGYKSMLSAIFQSLVKEHEQHIGVPNNIQ